MSTRDCRVEPQTRMRRIALAIIGIYALASAPFARADDSASQSSGGSQSSDAATLKMLQQFQALQSANSNQALMQDGFAYLGTFAGISGQPEITIGLQVLQGALEFSGMLSSPSANTSQALSLLTTRVAQMSVEIDALRDGVNADTMALVKEANGRLGDAVYDLNTNLMVQLNTLYPPSGQNPTFQRKLKLPASPSAVGMTQTATPDAAALVAANVKVYLDKIIDREDSLFLGYDIVTDKKTGVKSPAPGLKPYPALGTYLFGLQLWVTAMEIESGGTDAGHSRVKQKYAAALKRHVAFLSSVARAGADPNYPKPIQDRITDSVRCVWQVNGPPGAMPDQQGRCSAGLSCQDDIARSYPKIPPTSIVWTQDLRNVCALDPVNTQLSDRSFPPEHLNPIERTLQVQYGLLAMDRVADTLQRVAAFGTAVSGPGFAGNFGGRSDSTFFVYAVDGSGAVKSFTGARNQPLPQPAAAGTIADIRALIPGGGMSFYALTRDGKLNWYQFGATGSKAFSGPVTIASGFGGYKQVFGGGDGVIYAIQNDGTLLWFRHAGFASGAPATLTGPKPVASGFGQYKTVFSAGNGIIYAIASDGTLLWYEHKNFLTGAETAINAKPGANANPSANAKGIGNTRPVALKVEPNALVPPSQLEGPVAVNSGWGAFRQVIPSGNGVLLAVQNDGTLLWYRHDDYLTGTSTGGSAGAANTGAAGAHPSNWETPAAANAQHQSAAGSAVASSWGAPGQPSVNSATSASQRVGAGTPQWGAQIQHGTAPGAPATPSALHGASESPSSLHPAATPPKPGDIGPAAARQNVIAPAVLGAAGHTPHWEGPTTIASHSGWEAFAEIAGSLPVTVQTNVIK